MVWSEGGRVRSACVLVLVCVWSVHTASADTEPELTSDLDAWLSPQQTELELWRWAPRGSPAPLSRCAALRDLSLNRTRVSELPARWVAACPRLYRLGLHGAGHLTRLPNELLANTPELTELTLAWGRLEELPSDLFAYSPKLEAVDLSENSLVTLPSGIFASCVALRTLYLSDNELQASSLRALTEPALRGLTGLYLHWNPIHELCNSSQDVSTLSSLRNLEFLSLASTNITTVCRDWRTLMPRLETLDLSYTRVSRLQRADLEFVREIKSSVWLEGAPLTGVQFDESDYRSGRRPARARVRPLRCAGGRELGRLQEHELMCDVGPASVSPLPLAASIETIASTYNYN